MLLSRQHFTISHLRLFVKGFDGLFMAKNGDFSGNIFWLSVGWGCMDIKLGVRSKGKLIGHEGVFALFERVFNNDRLSHAYLITGPREVGKANFALRLAQMVLGERGVLEVHPDFAWIERGDDPKTGKARAIIALDQIRDVRGKLSRKPMLGGWQSAIIKDAHLMNSAAANALLKTLEEPQPRTLILLTAHDTESVMPTVRSRCQEIRLNRVSRTEIEQALVERGVLKAQAGLLSRLADGCPQRAVRLAENSDELDCLKEMRDSVLAMVGSNYAARWKTVEDLLPKKHVFQEAGARAQEFLDVTAELLRDALLIRNGQEDRIIHVDVIDGLRKLANTEHELAYVLEDLYRARQLVRENVNPRNVLQHFVLSL